MDTEAGTAEIIVPQIDETPQEITLDKLNEEYMGFAFFLKRLYVDRRPEYDDDVKDDNKNWFFGTLWRFKGIYGNVILASLMINIFVVVGPLFTMNVYDRIIPHNAVDTLWVLALGGMFVVYSFDLFLKFIRTYFLEVIAKKSDVILSSKIFEQALNIKLKEKPKSVGSFANNIKDFDSIRSFYSSSALVAFIDFPFVIIFLLVIFYVAGALVVVPIAIIIAIISYSLIVRKPLQKSIESTYESSARRNGLLIEALSNLENIKSFNANSSVQWGGWEERTGDIAGKSLKSRMLSNSLSSVSVFFTQLSTVGGIIVTGVYLIKQGDLTMGGLIATVILSSRTIAPMSQVASLLSNYQQMKTSLSGLNDLMAKDVERPEQKNFLRRPVFKGAVEFKNVSFSYPEETNVVLSGINLKINPNERIGIIGQVGSGKSTFSKLILGLYEPTEGGSVFVDGIDIQQMDPADLRHNISYVPQDVTLFSGSVRENIVFKAPHSDDEAILEAVKVGNVNTFTDKHPMGGLDLFVGERGANLSGGQRQAVGVARAC